MASAQLGAVFRKIGRLFGPGSVNGLSEAQLLARFVEARDEAAFEALVGRYGPMVLSVCRQFLADPHAAEDAFQATFLVLVRRARSIRDRDRLGNWLYGVAVKVARRARADGAKRRKREAEGHPVGAEPIEGGPDLSGLDLGPVLHEELARLPEKYRAPMVLCFLDGRTCEEAARQLGWPVGSVKGRISRAKDILRTRLARRGVTASAALVGATLSKTSEAAVPPLLLDQTVRAAMGLAAGGAIASAGSASASAVALADGVVMTMILSKAKWMTVGLALVASAAGGAAVMARQGEGQEKGATKPASSRTAEEKAILGAAKDPAMRSFEELTAATPVPEGNLSEADLRKRHVAEAKQNLDVQFAFYQNGTVTMDRLLEAARAHLDARIQAVHGDPQASLKAVEENVRLLQGLANWEKARFENGIAALPNVTAVNLALTEAKIQLVHAREMASSDDGDKPKSKSAQPRKRKQETPIPIEGGGAMGPANLNENDGVESDDPDRDKKIAEILQKPIAMPFQNETPLEDAIKYIQTATTGPDFERGVPIYVDQVGLQEAEKTMQSPVILNLEGVKLKTSLRLLLRQLSMGYYIKHGLVIITSLESEDYKDATRPRWREEQFERARRIREAGGMPGQAVGFGQPGGFGGPGGGVGAGGAAVPSNPGEKPAAPSQPSGPASGRNPQ